MASLAGSEAKLSEALRALLRLEYDVLDAYSAAIEQLDDVALKIHSERLRSDHERHARELGAVLLRRGVAAPEALDAARGQVVFGDWTGDRGILRAVLGNEQDVVAAYDRVRARRDLGPDLEFLLESQRDDERRHRGFIEEQLAVMGDVPDEPATEEFLRARWG